MKKRIVSYLYKIRKFLTLSRELRNDFNRILLTAQITIIGAFACILFAMMDFGFGRYTSMWFDISAIVIFISALYLFIAKGMFGLSKSIIIVYSTLVLVLNGSRDGRYAGNEFLWFAIFAGNFLLFSSNEKKYIAISFFAATLGIIFLELTDYSYFIVGQQNFEYNYFNYIICFFVSISMICLFMYYLIRLNNESEKKMERLNNTLLNRNENLKKINSELDSFVYKASHDMRAPLTSLLGLIEIAKKETDLKVIHHFMDMQDKSIRKLDGYISDILDISKNARIEVRIEEINFQQMVNQIFEQLDFLENSAKVKRTIQVFDTVPFYSDKVRISIILNNLLSNSIRYADFSKPISTISVKVRVNIESAEISLHDNGQGIPEEHLGKVFDMFYRATETNNGSGLGLYIVKETLQKIKGSVTIASEYGKYTEIKITLPNQYEAPLATS